MTLIDFTLSNARRFYSSMENPFAVKGLNKKTSERRWSVRLKEPYHITVTATCTIQNYQIAADVDDLMSLA